MKHALKFGIVLLCIVTVSVAFAGRVDNDHRISARKKALDSHHTTPYRPPLRQGQVLFVEDGAGYYPPTNPDPVWDSVLTELYGDGNFGWFGPTSDYLEDGPDLATMQMYDLVIWHNYDMWEPGPALTANDMANIGDYLTGGGKVWLISQDGLYTGVPYFWMDTYFHLDTAYEDYAGAGIESLHVHGLAEIDCHSMISVCDYATNDYWSDDLVPDAAVGCHVVLEDTINDADIGIFYPGFGEWQTAFWTADVRDTTFTTYWSTVIDIITGMLDAFGVAPGVEETPYRKSAHELMLNVRPVPVVQTAVISFAIPVADNVKLEVFNTLGQRVVTLIDAYKHAGSYNVTWNGRDAKGVDVANGIYFVRLTYADVSRTANIVVVE
jgi:hypothetical protein